MSIHVVSPLHIEFFAVRLISTAQNKAIAEDVGEFSTVAISTSHNFLVVVVVVAASKQLSEDKMGYVDLKLLVNHHWDTLAVVVYFYTSLLFIEFYPKGVHSMITLVIICCIH